MSTELPIPARFLSLHDKESRVPVHVVWEITLACNLRCTHCGSRAGKPRPNELTTDESLRVVDSLARLGTRELTLIGGEAYLRRDWVEIVKAAKSHGLYVTIQTGGFGLSESRLGPAIEAGLDGIGVSLDGIEITHDRLRGMTGAFQAAMSVLTLAKSFRIRSSVNSQICSANKTELRQIKDLIVSVGVTHWQTQLTVAMGNAVDNSELLLQPYEIDEISSLLGELYMEGLDEDLLIVPGNNIGYFGPFEHLWRGTYERSPFWTGCSAGTTVMGIEADGTVKGCPSLDTSSYSGGNVRNTSLEEIWKSSPRLTSAVGLGNAHLWGFCRDCYYATICQAGCTWTSHSLLGKSGNNPYCHHRVLELARQGKRERIIKMENASPASFGIGRFEILEEALPDADNPSNRTTAYSSNKLVQGTKTSDCDSTLKQCKSCNCFVFNCETMCPFCCVSIEESDRTHRSETRQRQELMQFLNSRITNVESLI